MLELAGALVIVTIIASIAYPTWASLQQGSHNVNTRNRLQSVQVDLARIGGISPANPYTTGLESKVHITGLSAVGGDTPAGDENSVSVAPYPGDSTRAIAAMQADNGACYVIIVWTGGRTYWGKDAAPTDDSCSALNSGISIATVTGSFDAPAVLHV